MALAIALNVVSNNYQPLMFQLEDKGRDVRDSPFQQMVGAIKGLEVSAPPEHDYATIRVFTYDRKKKVWIAKDKLGRVNVLTLEDGDPRP